MLQAKLLYCLSNNKHICILSSLSAQAQWEITERGGQTLPKYVVKLQRSWERLHLSLTARDVLRCGPELRGINGKFPTISEHFGKVAYSLVDIGFVICQP